MALAALQQILVVLRLDLFIFQRRGEFGWVDIRSLHAVRHFVR